MYPYTIRQQCFPWGLNMLLVEPFVLTGPTQDGSLQFSFKRYRPQSRSTNNSGGLALLFVHGVGTRELLVLLSTGSLE